MNGLPTVKTGDYLCGGFIINPMNYRKLFLPVLLLFVQSTFGQKASITGSITDKKKINHWNTPA